MNNLIEVMIRSGEEEEVIEEKVYIIESHLDVEGYEWLKSMIQNVEDIEQVDEIINTIDNERVLLEEEQREISKDEIKSIIRRKEEEDVIKDYIKVKELSKSAIRGNW